MPTSRNFGQIKRRKLNGGMDECRCGIDFKLSLTSSNVLFRSKWAAMKADMKAKVRIDMGLSFEMN